LSLKISGEIFQIISTDSVQIYRYLDVGSCKPSIKQRETVRHYLVDIVDPDFRFTAGDFCREAENACSKIFHAGFLPLFVGGCAFYANAFFQGLSEIPAVGGQIREQLKNELNARGLSSLYGELSSCDRVFAESIHENDRQRILRGLEVYRETGRPLSSYFSERKSHESADTLYIGIGVEMEELKERISRRIDGMMRDGFLEEVSALRKKGYCPALNSMRSIGYRELNDHIDGKTTLEDAVQKMKVETRRYARRQMTWYRRNSRIHWFSVDEAEKIKELLYKWVDDKNISI
jgi:tRNA dimethylallyltransferase